MEELQVHQGSTGGERAYGFWRLFVLEYLEAMCVNERIRGHGNRKILNTYLSPPLTLRGRIRDEDPARKVAGLQAHDQS